MAALNQCNFIGNVGRDPETRYTQGGKAVANLSIAVTEKWKDKEHTEWVKCVFWGKLAEIVENYVKKGSKLFISGRMQTRKWQDSEGNDKYTTEIVANQMQMLDSKGSNQGQDGQSQEQSGPGFGDGDIPF